MAVIVLAIAGANAPKAYAAESLGLQNGDIVLHKSQSSQAVALQAATGSSYTHTGLVFLRDDVPYVLEAVEPVKWTSFATWEQRGLDQHVVVVRRVEPFSVEEASAVRTAAEHFLHRHYDVLFQWSDDTIYRSELVYKAYMRGLGLEAGHLVPLATQDLQSPAVQALIRARGSHNLDPSELIVPPVSIMHTAGFEVVASSDPEVPVLQP